LATRDGLESPPVHLQSVMPFIGGGGILHDLHRAERPEARIHKADGEASRPREEVKGRDALRLLLASRRVIGAVVARGYDRGFLVNGQHGWNRRLSPGRSYGSLSKERHR